MGKTKTVICGCSLSDIRALIRGPNGNPLRLQERIAEIVAEAVKQLGWRSGLEFLTRIPANDSDRYTVAMHIVRYAVRASETQGLIETYTLEDAKRLSGGYRLALCMAQVAIDGLMIDRDQNGFSNPHKQERMTRIACAALTLAKYGFIQGPTSVRSKRFGKKLARLSHRLQESTRPLVACMERNRAQRQDGQWTLLLRETELLSSGLPDASALEPTSFFPLRAPPSARMKLAS